MMQNVHLCTNFILVCTKEYVKFEFEKKHWIDSLNRTLIWQISVLEKRFFETKFFLNF